MWFLVDGFFVQVEKENILAKMQGAETPNIAEQNQVGRNHGAIMNALLNARCSCCF